MNTLPRRIRRRFYVPIIPSIDEWDIKRRRQIANYQQAVEHDQPGTHRIGLDAQDLATLAKITVVPTGVTIALAAASIDIILAGGSLVSAGCGIGLLIRTATRSATEGRQPLTGQPSAGARR